MQDANYLREVREHYENYPYPVKDPQNEKTRLIVPVTEALDRMNYYCFSGRRDFTKPFRALVAGGGTGDAIIALAEQLNGTPAELFYIDMSSASMKIAQECARIRGLENITWINDSLLNIPKLGLGMFDYINCSGVLHHLANPDEGLRILAESLKEDGAMGIMVYAKYGRTAVYQMQEILRLLNKDEPDLQKRVDCSRALLNRLPSTNWFFHSPQMIINETATDIGVYDLLLHSQDRAYSIPELYDFLGMQGLTPIVFMSDDTRIASNLYNPLSYLPDPKLAEQAQKLSLREQQTLAELLNGKICKHTFYTARQVPERIQPTDMDAIPVLGFSILNQGENLAKLVAESGDVIVLDQGDSGSRVIILKTPHLEQMIRYVDGKRTLKEIFRKVMDMPSHKGEKPNFQSLTEEFNLLFQNFVRFDWMFLRHKSASYAPSPETLQQRVNRLYETAPA